MLLKYLEKKKLQKQTTHTNKTILCECGNNHEVSTNTGPMDKYYGLWFYYNVCIEEGL